MQHGLNPIFAIFALVLIRKILVTLHIFAVIKLKCAVIRSKLGSVKNQS